jgi:hypothetical protein
MAGKGKKTFVAGEVLLAQDVNDYLMDQSVMNFATSAARSSAIPTPTEGMTSYIATTGTASIPQIETYTGSAWQTPYGLTLVATAPLSGSSTQVTNVFSATYDNYQVVLSSVRTSVAQNTGLQIGGVGSGYYASEYFGAVYSTSSGNVVFANQNNASSYTTGIVTGTSTADTGGGIIFIHSPFLAETTRLSTVGGDPRPGGQGRSNTGFQSSATSYSSLSIIATGGNFTSGTIRVYGMRNA